MDRQRGKTMQPLYTSTADDGVDDRAAQSTVPDRQPVPFRELVAQRAYDRFQRRGGEHGHDQEDWFEAERQLKDISG